MTRYDIEHCDDVGKLRKLCLEYRHQLFWISETLVDESKWHISAEDAITKIREYLVENQHNIDKIMEEEGE